MFLTKPSRPLERFPGRFLGLAGLLGKVCAIFGAPLSTTPLALSRTIRSLWKDLNPSQAVQQTLTMRSLVPTAYLL